MRLSVNKNDMGYSIRWANKAQPYLNGKAISKAIIADEGLFSGDGYIERFKTDEKANVMVDRSKGEIFRETLHGNVNIALIR